LYLLQLPYHTSGPSCVDQEQLEQLCKLIGLEELTVELFPSVQPGSSKQQITKLKSLTSLVLNGVTHSALVGKLSQLKKLRRLTVTVNGCNLGSDGLELEALEHVEQLDLG
jgi:hypothetical protein